MDLNSFVYFCLITSSADLYVLLRLNVVLKKRQKYTICKNININIYKENLVPIRLFTTQSPKLNLKPEPFIFLISCLSLRKSSTTSKFFMERSHLFKYLTDSSSSVQATIVVNTFDLRLSKTFLNWPMFTLPFCVYYLL